MCEQRLLMRACLLCLGCILIRLYQQQAAPEGQVMGQDPALSLEVRVLCCCPAGSVVV